MRRSIVRAVLLIVVLLALAGSAAVAGRTFLPEITFLGAAPTPTASTDHLRRMESAKHDFDAASATIRSAAGSEQAANSYFFARSQKTLGIPSQLQQIRNAISTIPGTDGPARLAFFDAAILLERAAAVNHPYFQSADVRDLLNRADASWRKGADALR